MYLGVITVFVATVQSLPTSTYHLHEPHSQFDESIDGESLNRTPRRLYTGLHNRNEDTIKESHAFHGNDNKIFKRSDGDIIIHTHGKASANQGFPEQNIDLTNMKRSISTEPSQHNSHVDCSKIREAKKINSPIDCVAVENEITTESIESTTKLTTDQFTDNYTNNYNRDSNMDDMRVDLKVNKVESDSDGKTSEDEGKGPVSDDVRNATGAESAQDIGKPGSDTAEDKWIWGVTEEAETTPDINNRVAFDGGSCPTGKIKVAGKCVYVD